MSNKPDWKDAPERAKFLAQDSDGSWFWYEDEPFQHTDGVWATYGASWDAVKIIERASTLEPRP